MPRAVYTFALPTQMTTHAVLGPLMDAHGKNNSQLGHTEPENQGNLEQTRKTLVKIWKAENHRFWNGVK